MGKRAFRATLDVARFADVFKISPTTIPQQIKRTVTKQAIEGSQLDIFMAWKESTFHVFEELIAVHTRYAIGFPHWTMSS